MAYGIKYYNSFISSQFKEPITIQILGEDYVGVPTKKRIGATLHLGESGDERWEPIKKTTATISLVSETDQEFNEFFTNSDKKYQVRILRGLKPVLETPILIWSGFLESDSYGEPYWTDRNYNVSVTARDNLGTLENIKYLDASEEAYSGLEKGSTIISRCLAKTGLSLNIFDQINIYSDTMNVNTPTLEQEYFNQDGYVNDKGEIYSCLDVLTNILKGHGAQIRQSLGVWVIRELGNYYELNTVNKGDGSYKWINKDSGLNFEPAWKKFTIDQDYKVAGNIFKGFPKSDDDFEFLGPLQGDYGLKNWIMNTPFISHQDGINQFWIDMPSDTLDGYVGNNSLIMDATPSSFKVVLDTRVFYNFHATGTIDIDIDIDIISNNSKILTDTGWINYVAQERQLEFSNIKSSANFSELTVFLDNIPETGPLEIRLWNSQTAFIYRLQFSDVRVVPVGISENIPISTGRSINSSINDNNNVNPDTIEIEVGQCPDESNSDVTYLGGIFDINGNVHQNWHRKTYPLGVYNLLEVIARGYNTQYEKSAWQINGSMIWNFDMWTCINEGGHKMLLNSLDWQMYNDEASCEFIEIFEYDGTINIISESQITDGDKNDFFQVNENKEFLAFTIDEGAPKRISDLATETDFSNSYMILDDPTKTESKKYSVSALLNSIAAKGRLTSLSSRSINITFAAFSSTPNLVQLDVYRMTEIVTGNWQRQDVLYKFTSATPLTTSSLTFEIDASESLTGVIIEYIIQ